MLWLQKPKFYEKKCELHLKREKRSLSAQNMQRGRGNINKFTFYRIKIYVYQYICISKDGNIPS